MKNYSVLMALSTQTPRVTALRSETSSKVWFTKLTCTRFGPSYQCGEMVQPNYDVAKSIPEALLRQEALAADLTLTDVLVEDYDYLYLSEYCRDEHGRLAPQSVQKGREEVFMTRLGVFEVQLEVLKWLQKEYHKTQVQSIGPLPKLQYLKRLATELVLSPPEEMAALREYIQRGIDAGCFTQWGSSPNKNDQKRIELLITTIYVFLLCAHHTANYSKEYRSIRLEGAMVTDFVWLEAIRDAEIERRNLCTRFRIPQGFGLLHRVHF